MDVSYKTCDSEDFLKLVDKIIEANPQTDENENIKYAFSGSVAVNLFLAAGNYKGIDRTEHNITPRSDLVRTIGDVDYVAFPSQEGRLSIPHEDLTDSSRNALKNDYRLGTDPAHENGVYNAVGTVEINGKTYTIQDPANILMHKTIEVFSYAPDNVRARKQATDVQKLAPVYTELSKSAPLTEYFIQALDDTCRVAKAHLNYDLLPSGVSEQLKNLIEASGCRNEDNKIEFIQATSGRPDLLADAKQIASHEVSAKAEEKFLGFMYCLKTGRVTADAYGCALDIGKKYGFSDEIAEITDGLMFSKTELARDLETLLLEKSLPFTALDVLKDAVSWGGLQFNGRACTNIFPGWVKGLKEHDVLLENSDIVDQEAFFESLVAAPA